MPSKASGIINKVLKIFFGCTAFLAIGIIISLVVIVAAIFKVTGNLPYGPNLGPGEGSPTPNTPGTPPGVPPFDCAGKHYVYPVQGASNYGGVHHDYSATDIFGSIGTPLVAATDGTAIRVHPNDSGDGGISFTLQGSDGFMYYYAHMNSINVHSRQTLNAGDNVGTLGKTGNARSTPAHLHFGVSSGCQTKGFYPSQQDDYRPGYRSGCGQVSPIKYPESGHKLLDAWRAGKCVNPATGT